LNDRSNGFVRTRGGGANGGGGRLCGCAYDAEIAADLPAANPKTVSGYATENENAENFNENVMAGNRPPARTGYQRNFLDTFIR
jgi:hypothetical protein